MNLGAFRKFITSSFSAIIGLIIVAALPQSAYAFGTVNQLGQNSEHGRITRHALACKPGVPRYLCFEAKTLDSLAGRRGTFGAVGAPDRGRGMLTSYAHCSGGDYFAVPDYPHSKAHAQAVLTECRTYMASNLRHAVMDAERLLDRRGNINSGETSISPGCVYRGSQHGRAKCNILAHMGRILHASQDFYSHSNWVDLPDLTRAISPENPHGLGRHSRANWLDLRRQNPRFPEGLISGCFDNRSFLGEDKGCLYGHAGAHRVRHLDVNKDTGTIDPRIGHGTTERGAVNDNFKHAIEAAISDSSDKWRTYTEILVAVYGPQRGSKMICALTSDNPDWSC